MSLWIAIQQVPDWQFYIWLALSSAFFLNCLFTYMNKYGSYMVQPKIFFKIEIKWFFLTCLWQPDIINWILIFSFFLSEYKYTALHILFKKKGSAVHHEKIVVHNLRGLVSYIISLISDKILSNYKYFLIII